MKKNLVFLALLMLLVLPARANVTAILDAGELTGPDGITAGTNSMQFDNTSPSLNGSLLLLVDIGSSTNATIDTSITAGNFVAGTNTVLAAGGFNINGGTQETNNTLTIASGATGDNVALLWFPQLTYNEYKSGDLTVAGDYFGAYTPSPLGETPADGGDVWVLPSGGTLYLDFFTSNSGGGGNEPPSLGYANYQIESVPEPSAFVAFGIGLFVLFCFVRRRKAA
jgi:hypothetical protein